MRVWVFTEYTLKGVKVILGLFVCEITAMRECLPKVRQGSWWDIKHLELNTHVTPYEVPKPIEGLKFYRDGQWQADIGDRPPRCRSEACQCAAWQDILANDRSYEPL